MIGETPQEEVIRLRRELAESQAADNRNEVVMQVNREKVALEIENATLREERDGLANWINEGTPDGIKFLNSPTIKRHRDIAKARKAVCEAAAEYTTGREYQNVEACRKDQDRLEQILLDALAHLHQLEGETK